MAKESDMYPNTYKALRKRYPATEGWEIVPQDHNGTYIPDFVVYKSGKKYTYKIPVEVKLEYVATAEHISQLNGYSSKLAGPNVKIENKILVYPVGTNISLVPADIEVIFLRSF